MVDALVSGASAARHAGSNPVPGTKQKRKLPKGDFRFCFMLLIKNRNKKQIAF